MGSSLAGEMPPEAFLRPSPVHRIASHSAAPSRTPRFSARQSASSKFSADAMAVAGAMALGVTGGFQASRRSCRTRELRARVARAMSPMSPGDYGLPPKLAGMAGALSALPNDRMRYQQLMALAGKLKPMADDLKVPENKVPGCLSVVHVHASLEEDGTVTFQGDSDALISKGLVALLVLCLSGCTPEEIAGVQPEFIKASGISASLTPGRNNGFFNMFKLMNKKVARLKAAKAAESGESGAMKAGEDTETEETPELQIYNTLSRSKEAHLGYDVTFVRNVTDIDDKIIKRSQETGETAEELARRMEEEMARDAKSLGCASPDFEPRVSESIEEITSMVETLVKKDFAYAGKGDVYFRVRRFETYGRLSRCSLDGNEAGARIEVADVKEAPEDFVLWKSAKPLEPSWESPWGPGRPGWHIECSAMAKRYLGDTLDIHGGGPDLVFPHHENEIAQSEAANDQPYVKTWMHCAAVRSTGNEKMSKSLGNFVTIRDVLKQYDGEVVRFYLLSSQYRRPMMYSEEALEEAQERLLKLYSSLRGAAGAQTESPDPECEQQHRFLAAMANDFDTVNAIAALTDLSRELLQLQQGDHGAEFQTKARQLRAMGAVLGILQRDPEEVCKGPVDSDFEAKVEDLIQARADARKAKDFAKADAIRDELTGMGVVIEDGAKGTSWRVASLA